MDIKEAKKGSRVRLLVDVEAISSNLPVDSTGIIMEDTDYSPTISWDNFTDGHDGGGYTNNSSCWCVNVFDIELI